MGDLFRTDQPGPDVGGSSGQVPGVGPGGTVTISGGSDAPTTIATTPETDVGPAPTTVQTGDVAPAEGGPEYTAHNRCRGTGALESPQIRLRAAR